MDPIRLTSFSSGGGCGCKIPPQQLSDILSDIHSTALFPPQLMVGFSGSDDAAVWRLSDEQSIIATTDFFMPIVDDPYDFGQIAATNALSDIYAMGGQPIMALSICAMPVERVGVPVVKKILEGGQNICRQVGVPMAGGHSIKSTEPIYGLAVIGLAHPKNIKTNSQSRNQDDIILGKPLGTGIYSAALKKGNLPSELYKHLIAGTTKMNTPGAALAHLPGVHSMTDVTGFGLLGHLFEMCKNAQLSVIIEKNKIPFYPDVFSLLEKGYLTGASNRNQLHLENNNFLASTLQNSPILPLLTDPQTSGGLLVACDPKETQNVLKIFHENNHSEACVIGQFLGESGVQANIC